MSRKYPINVTPCSVCGTEHIPDGCPAAVGARVGTVLEGKYELVRLVGQGGMGEVYEGRHRVIGRRVAVKFLHSEYARNPDVVLRFENEARAAGGSEHENIAGVYDVGSLPDGTRYLVMEFLDGEDVDKLVRREAPLPAVRAAFIVIQACRALDAVHKRGIVHRDLKPENLFLAKRADKTDLVKVIDFGIAKLKTADGRAATRTGAAIGTAHYMSPEQARGERAVDTRSDVYSLGVILYELLSGKKPHDGDSLLQILHQVMTQPPVPLESVRSGLPDGLYGVVRRAMAAHVAERYPTVAELGDALLPFSGRALAPIRSEPAAFAALTADAGETREATGSAVGAPSAALGPSMVAVVRGDPSHDVHPSSVARTRGTRTLVAGGIAVLVASAAGFGVLGMVFLRPTPRPAKVEAESPSTPAIAGASAWSPTESNARAPVTTGSASPLTADASIAGGPTSAPAPPIRIQPSGQRTRLSEHPAAIAATGAASSKVPDRPPVEPSASPAPAPAPAPPSPPPKPATTDRSDNPF